mmetsp:Transcript_25067/g.47239  ORF Transcript_25067/g.47239 Transcript_25067/m.47239 type:complete len:609 (+) Transcript_25067:68-1894(+)
MAISSSECAPLQADMLSDIAMCAATLVGDSLSCSSPAFATGNAKPEDIDERLTIIMDFAEKFRAEFQMWISICSVEDGLKLLPTLQDVVNKCGTCDRVVVAGMGNVGKSSVGNALLGEKVWTVSTSCMTSCLCEAHDDKHECEGVDGERDPGTAKKENINKNATTQKADFGEMVKRVLNAWAPIQFLQGRTILVDLPGLDQKKEYIGELRKYWQTHSADAVVLLYVVDVHQKLRNPDREFLQELLKSPWSQSLLLLVNMCDTICSDDEEEPVDYKRLVSDIHVDASLYCQPTTFPLSMKECQKEVANAVQQWDDAYKAIQAALAQKKAMRLSQCVQVVSSALESLGAALADAEEKERQLKDMRDKLAKAKADLEVFRQDKEKFVEKRTGDIKQAMEEHRDRYLKALLQTHLPHRGERVQQQEMTTVYKELDEAIMKEMGGMVVNDFQKTADASKEVHKIRILEETARVTATVSVPSVFEGLALSVSWFPALLFFVPLEAAACLVWLPVAWAASLWSWGVAGRVVVVDDYRIEQRVDTVWQYYYENCQNKLAVPEHDAMLKQFEKIINEEEEQITRLEEEKTFQELDAGFKEVYDALVLEFEKIVKKWG